MSGAAPPAPSPEPLPSGPLLVLLNARAAGGQARVRWEPARRVFREARRPVVVREVSRLDEVAPTVRDGLRAFAPAAVVAAGGDGTIREVAAVLLGTGVPLGVLPLGTGNGLAWSLRLPQDPAEAARVLATGGVRAMDVGRANGRPFLNVAGAGLDAELAGGVKALPVLKGLPAYVITALSAIQHFKPVPIQVECDGRRFEAPALLVAVGNGSTYGRGVRICPDALPDDGWLDVTVIEALTPVELAQVIRLLLRGARHGRHPRVRMLRARRVAVAAETPVRLHLDGDVLDAPPAEIVCEPAALPVVVPAAGERAARAAT